MGAVIPSLISATVALLAGALAIFGQMRVARLSSQLALLKAESDRRAAAEQTTRRYREPLARAAFDLQSRLFNIVAGRFIRTFFSNGDARTQAYAVHHTAYVIAQFFAWTELVRLLEFLDPQHVRFPVDERTKLPAAAPAV
jgi:hypothetical protein